MKGAGVVTKLDLLAGERQESESDRAAQACNDYLRLGPGRTLPKLVKKYGKTRKNSEPPTDSHNTLERWSSDFDWPARATEYDATREAEKNERRRKEFDAGLALDFERVRKLKRLALFLEKQIYEQDDPTALITATTNEEGELEATISASPYPNVWVRDVKAINNQRVYIFRFNQAILGEYRAALDDLAKEVGDRKQRVDMEHRGSLSFSADDAAQAQSELDEWKWKSKPPSAPKSNG